uniref:hypothetical protein n=1 Tax=Roseivirga sp. TaxID=1964215 RepID=UPI0040489C89
MSRLLHVRDAEIPLRVIGAVSGGHLLNEYELSNLEYLGKQPYDKVAKLVADASMGISFRKSGKIG